MKKVGSSIYVHKSNLKELCLNQKKLIAATIKFLPKDFNFEVVKINIKNNTVSFIESNNWNEANEPNVGNSYLLDMTGIRKFTKTKGQIYHHKWRFVSIDYTGFDIDQSKKRSESWENVVPKNLKSKIGFKKYWDEILEKYSLDM